MTNRFRCRRSGREGALLLTRSRKPSEQLLFPSRSGAVSLSRPPRGRADPGPPLPAHVGRSRHKAPSRRPHRPHTRPSGLSSSPSLRGTAIRSCCPLSGARGLNSHRASTRPTRRGQGGSGGGPRRGSRAGAGTRARQPRAFAQPSSTAARPSRSTILTDLPAEVLQHPHLVATIPRRHRASAAARALRRTAGRREGRREEIAAERNGTAQPSPARPGPAPPHTHQPPRTAAPPPPAAALGGHQKRTPGWGQRGACVMPFFSQQASARRLGSSCGCGWQRPAAGPGGGRSWRRPARRSLDVPSPPHGVLSGLGRLRRLL